MPKLSNRQQKVILLLIEGKQDKEIAFALGVTARTVRRHIDNIKTAFEARTRIHAVAKYLVATHAGFLDAPTVPRLG
jgi:DNA-binding NarL/FixJ family response regulator